MDVGTIQHRDGRTRILWSAHAPVFLVEPSGNVVQLEDMTYDKLQTVMVRLFHLFRMENNADLVFTDEALNRFFAGL